MSTNDKTGQAKDYVLPVYVDSSILLDILASIEDGFSLVEKVTTRDSATEGTDRSIKGEFGLSNVLNNLFKIGMEASRTEKKDRENGEERQADRYHTYGSLLHRLRGLLTEMGLVKHFDGTTESWSSIRPSDFVELNGVFRPNPLIDNLNTLGKAVETYKLFAGFSSPAPSTSPSATRRSPGAGRSSTQALSPQSQNAQNSARQMEQIQKIVNSLHADVQKIEQFGIRTFVVELSPTPHTVVTSLFDKYLRDQSMTEISYGEFRLFGKVTQNISQGEAIDLLRGSGIGSVNEDLVQSLTTMLNEIGSQGAKLSKIVTKIEAPALRVVPIAIYV